MIMEELKCDKCPVKDEQKSEQSANDNLSKMVIAKCLDCEHNLCTTCLLEHQLISANLSHKLINLLSPSSEQQTHRGDDNESECRNLDDLKDNYKITDEINNNNISEKEFMYKMSNDEQADPEMIIKRRNQNDASSQRNSGGDSALEMPNAKDDFRETGLNNLTAKQQQMQLQHLQQIKQYQLNQQLITNKFKQQQQQQQAQAQVTNARLVQIESEITKTYNFYVQMLKERKEYLVKELNTIIQFALLNHSQNINKQLQIQYQLEMKKQQLEKEISDDYESLNGGQTQLETMNAETNLKSKLNLLNELNNLILVNNQLILQLKSNNPLMSIEFISNYSAIQTSIRNTFGYIRINPQQQQQQQQQQQSQQHQDIAQPAGQFASNKQNSQANNFNYMSNFHQSNSLQNGLSDELSILCDLKPNANELNIFSNNSNATNGASMSANAHQHDLITSPVSIMKKQKSASSFMSQNPDFQDLEDDAVSTNNLVSSSSHHNYEITSKDNLITLSAGSTSSNKSSKSIGSNSSSCSSSSSSSNQIASANTKHPLSYLYSNFINNNPKLNNFNYGLVANDENPAATMTMSTSKQSLTSQIQLQRSKMIYHCKFGEFGINDGQFTEPSGVTINTNNDIIVADTNSHRIQIFDKDGNFKFKFGECGKRDGQLLYPNRVSIVKQTGDIVVTERSPTHQIQIYNKYGQFLRKFGANILQHPRGVCVDYKGRIVVVECKVMRVIIFDLFGNVLNKFNCSKYLEFPNGVCCSNPSNTNNYKEEIYISDNRAHCIKVFDYSGNFLRQIGGEGITNYPIGVGINSNNEILVADNHNNFNLTVFTQEGKLINALESKVKHAQCFDVGLMDDGSIVLASKDYRIYVYKYVTNQGSFMGGNPVDVQIVVPQSHHQHHQQQHSHTQLLSPEASSTNSSTSSTSSLLGVQSSASNYELFSSDSHHGSNQLSGLSFNENMFSSDHSGSSLLIGNLKKFDEKQQDCANNNNNNTDLLNGSFSSLLNLSNSNSNSNTLANNLVSFFNGIL